MRRVGCLIDEHGRSQPSQTTVVQMRSAPVVGRALSFALVRGRSVVVKQTGFCRNARFDNVLQVSFLVLRNVLDRVTITGSGNECSGVNDECTQGLESILEARENVVAWPDVCRIVLWKVGKLVDGLLVQLWVLHWVGIVGTLQRVVPAVLERLFAATPAYQVTALRVLEVFLAK